VTEIPRTAVEATLHSTEGTGVVHLSSYFDTNIEDLWAALTDPTRLARWYARVDGDLRLGGEFTAFVYGSQWDGRGRIEICDPPRKLVVTLWEEEGVEHVASAELTADGDHTKLALEVTGVPEDFVWAYGAGWHAHVEDLGAHILGADCSEWPSGLWPRWDELAPRYREMTVEPLER
jgi:uncharacterized protein YndB with AHSA1/START domain